MEYVEDKRKEPNYVCSIVCGSGAIVVVLSTYSV